MPEEEEAQNRETFGNSTGWGAGQSEKAPAERAPATPEPEPQGAQEAPPASVVPDAQADPSPENVVPSEDQPSEQGTPSTTQTEEQKWNAPPKERWDEVIREKNEAQRLAQQAIEKFQAPATPAAPQPADPYAGMDAETAAQYRTLDARIDQRATQIANQKLQGQEAAITAGRQELAAMHVSNFLRDHPEIKQGSQEYEAIVAQVGQGHNLENARKLSQFNRLEEELRVLKAKQASTPRKVMANNSEATSGIPQTAGVPRQRGDWRNNVSDILDKGGSPLDAIQAAFGGG